MHEGVDALAASPEAQANERLTRNSGHASLLWITSAAVIALLFKLAIAYSTLGTNDAVSFYAFARSLSDHGLKWTYERGVAWLPNGPIFNHPPLTAYFLRFIYRLAHQGFFLDIGLNFPLLLRLPGITADCVVALDLLY